LKSCSPSPDRLNPELAADTISDLHEETKRTIHVLPSPGLNFRIAGAPATIFCFSVRMALHNIDGLSGQNESARVGRRLTRAIVAHYFGRIASAVP
jgi:hypothetical protein